MEDYSKPPIVLAPGGIANYHENFENDEYSLDKVAARLTFREFFRNYRQDQIYIYRDALTRQWDRREYFVEVDLEHLQEFNHTLYNNFLANPTEYLSLFELSAKDALKVSLASEAAIVLNSANIPDFQIILISSQNSISLRNLTAEHVNKLIKVPGIIIKCSEIHNKATTVGFSCSKCGSTKTILSKDPLAGISIPNKCDSSNNGEDCGSQPYEINVDLCEYIDQQKLKLQESPEAVPTGEMPRNIQAIVERYIVDRVSPGTRVSAIGILNLTSGKSKRNQPTSSIRTPYLRVIGLQIESTGGGRVTTHFAPEEEESLQQLARDPQIYEKLARSIAPQISGEYTIDIKKALACLLLGGSRTVLVDGTRLRGDINVLLMGDPSTAKSQFLKFIEQVAPVGVYTSGKGSSAAGLTAAVVKDSRGEFYLEGGAMVLADGGVICIDEFDKMRETDRVAIHEAMEQQTISVAKAGITTVLNSRASVLAAANPIYGRYDDLKEVGDNIDLMATILSRFDCIFIVRDIRDQERDKSIARHVLGVHLQASMLNTLESNNATPNVGIIEAPVLKKFVAYCRERCAPRLNDEAAAMLSGEYVHIRSRVRESLKDKNGESQVVPITVRQLEALIRISESLAKMRLSAEATVTDVTEAIRLFRVSTLNASESNPALLGNQQPQEVRRAEEFLKTKIGFGEVASAKNIIEQAVLQGHNYDTIKRAIAVMIMKGDVQEMRQKNLLKRLR